jgi:predicted transport protein
MKRKNIVGKLINFRGLVYAPAEENGVIFLFSKLTNDLNLYIETIRKGFPDCIAKRYIGHDRWEEVLIEFEYKSSDFKRHGHLDSMAKGQGCDMIVCWEHDWADCPKDIEVLELKSEYQRYPNFEITSPDKADQVNEAITHDLFDKYPATKKLFDTFHEQVVKIDTEVWAKSHKAGIYYYSPVRVFFSVSIQRQGIRVTLFTNGEAVKGVQPVTDDGSYAQKWGRLHIKTTADIPTGVTAIKESLKRIRKAIDSHESTGWYAETNTANDESVD